MTKILIVQGYPTVAEHIAVKKGFTFITEFFSLPAEKQFLDSAIDLVRKKQFVLVAQGSSRIQIWRRECELNPIKDSRERDRQLA